MTPEQSTGLQSSVVSYPDRGPYGRAEFKGNTSGYLIKEIMETYEINGLVLDPMEGSGTTRDVCLELAAPYLGYDLKQGDNILSARTRMKVQREVAELGGAQFIFWHPPYWNMVRYSQKSEDFCSGLYIEWVRRMRNTLIFLADRLEPDGIIAVLLGDLRREGQTYFLTDDVFTGVALRVAKLRPEVRVVKVQNNTRSAGVTDLPVRLVHEYATILRKGLRDAS